MDGPMRGLGVHALAEEPQVLHLLANESTREADLLASHYHHFLSLFLSFPLPLSPNPIHLHKFFLKLTDEVDIDWAHCASKDYTISSL